MNEDSTHIEIKLNGECKQLAAGNTVGQLLDQLAKDRGRAKRNDAVAVELNAEIVPQNQFELTILKPGDTVEVVTLVGGG